MMNQTSNILLQDSVLRIGEVCGIDGKRISIRVDKDKNASDLLLNGKIIKNASVGCYIEIRKGFLGIIGKVDGEELKEEYITQKTDNGYERIDKNKRILSATICGCIDNNRFVGGIKELPLIGNEVFILTDHQVHTIHNLLKDTNDLSIRIARTDIEGIPIVFPVDGLFNSHIAIFGNTGSGKSNTLAALYKEFIAQLSVRDGFEKCKFFFFDFNGEYIGKDCICENKIVYSLSTRNSKGQKVPITFDDFADIETLSVLFEATEKTQKPFLNRALRYYKNIKSNSDYPSYFKNIIKKRIEQTLLMTNKDAAYKILDYIEEIITLLISEEISGSLRDDIEFHSQSGTFFLKTTSSYFNSFPDAIKNTNLYTTAETISIIDKPPLVQFYVFVLLQLVDDLYRFKVQLDHILPVVNRFKSKQRSVEQIFEIKDDADIWCKKNIIILNLHDVNIDMKKTIPLLMAKHIYSSYKNKDGERNKSSLSIIIDEAHNILSKDSFRETEDWKDYRLETFEEIIKEGRKFGVFVTISSQRPNDISETIISQAHNYFIHQLLNEHDLRTIGNAVSYIDRVTQESIPTLPVGTCIFSGIATPMPLKIKIDELPDNQKPNSHTLKFGEITQEIVF
jgi:DNA helicase HerA-like ATPase